MSTAPNSVNQTDYYKGITAAFNAGKKSPNDTFSTNMEVKNILNNLNNTIINTCKNYSYNSNFPDISGSGNVTRNNFDSYLGKYRNDVDFEDTLNKQLLLDENNYFVARYGNDFYNKLLRKRDDYFNRLDLQNSPSTQSSIQSQCIQSNTNTLNPIDIYQSFSKYLPFVQPGVTNRKIEYREEEHDFLTKINSIMNIIYYVLFFLMLILLAGGNNLHIMKRAPIYVLLLLLPLLYPYFFKLVKFLYSSFLGNDTIHGPKNAFLDTNEESTIIDGYN
jgi:hypothetical protein